MMQRNVAAVRPNETLEDVARLLRDRSCGCVSGEPGARGPFGPLLLGVVVMFGLRGRRRRS